mmetsp:Transcript_73223/g.89868  ORF Transcript_73223/g.89868 Transcript_73223/m.89868 type:complete len:242 (+) Transcript_73223:66-791(+)
MVSILSISGEELLTMELNEFELADHLRLEVAKSLGVASCSLISPSGEVFGDQQLAEAKNQPIQLTAVVRVEDPLLEMMGFQDAEGNLLSAAPREELRRMALMAGEKLLKAVCSLLHPRDQRIYAVSWPFDGILPAPPAFAPGFCTISPHRDVVPAKTKVKICSPDSASASEYVSEDPMTAAEVIALCSREFSPATKKNLLQSPEAQEIRAREVLSTASVKQYSAHEIVIELGHTFARDNHV